ncbi:MAG: DNA repair protein RadC [Hyphomonadaceae bacterium]|nr:DNA repair protein RadC [Hyphomonadaceae bacterium]
MAVRNASQDHLKEHRTRLRQRFIQTGEAGLSNHEVLELLLFGVLPRIDTKPVAKRLIAHCGDLNRVLGAPLATLMQVEGVGETVAVHLKALQSVLVRAGREELQAQPVIASWSTLLNYLKTQLGGEKIEQFRVMFLDSRLRLLADEKMGDGTINHAPVYPREIARRALELSASAVILVHNHPGGDPSPSGADITMTREIIKALTALDVKVHDHVIVGRDTTSSMKALGLI